MQNHHNNVDQAELDKFQSISSRWWDPDSEFKTLHDINPLRVEYIEKGSQSLESKKLLDIGCGGGILSEAMAQKGAIVTGIDLAEKSLNVAKLHLHESSLSIDYQLSSAEAFAEQNQEAFDIITCMELLEHVPNPAPIIEAAANMVRPGGDLFFSTLNRNPKSYVLAIVGAEYIMNMVPKGTHQYNKFIKPSELCQLARAAQLEVVDISGMTYNPLTRHYSLRHDIDVNYLIHFKKS